MNPAIDTCKASTMADHICTNGMPNPVLVTYGWPREAYANGVISYAAEIVAGMRRIGAEPRVAALNVAEGTREEFVSRIPAWREMHGRTARLALAVFGMMCPHVVNSRLHGASLLSEIRRLKREAGVDICEIEEAHGTARYLAPRSPIPVVVRLHGPWFLNGTALGVEQDRSYWRRVRDEGESITAAHGISAPSRSVLEAVRSFYGLSLEAAEVIPNPVQPVGVQERWNLRGCEPDRILFVGRFDRHKGGDIIVDALAKLRGDRPDCRLTFVGPDRGVAGEDGSRTNLRDYIDARASGAIDAGSVQWLGLQPSDRLADLRRHAMVTVVCSRYENFPMAALEAMALGCPVVGTQVGGIPEIIQHEHNGLLCRPADADDLAEKILVLLRNPEFGARLGAQAAIDAATRYHPDEIARRTLAFYLRVIDTFEHVDRKGRLPTP